MAKHIIKNSYNDNYEAYFSDNGKHYFDKKSTIENEIKWLKEKAKGKDI
jgi:hypothetical protein